MLENHFLSIMVILGESVYNNIKMNCLSTDCVTVENLQIKTQIYKQQDFWEENETSGFFKHQIVNSFCLSLYPLFFFYKYNE